MNINFTSPFVIGPVNQAGVALIEARRTTSSTKLPTAPPTINQLLSPYYGQAQNSRQATQAVNTVNSTQAQQATQYVQPGAKPPVTSPVLSQTNPPTALELAILNARRK